MRARTLAVPLFAALLAALSWISPGSAQPARPIELTRLAEREAWALVERAAPGDVFLVQGRRIEARDLQRRLPRIHAAAEERRRKLQAIAQPQESDRLETLRRIAALEQRASDAAQRAALERTLREIRAALGPDTPEVRTLRTEMVRLSGQWTRATPEERRAIEARLRAVQEQLRRLGAPF